MAWIHKACINIIIFGYTIISSKIWCSKTCKTDHIRFIQVCPLKVWFSRLTYIKSITSCRRTIIFTKISCVWQTINSDIMLTWIPVTVIIYAIVSTFVNNPITVVVNLVVGVSWAFKEDIAKVSRLPTSNIGPVIFIPRINHIQISIKV